MKKENFFDKSPSNQNAIDIFENQWFSIMPQELGCDSKGQALLCDDGRIHWAAEKFGGYTDKTILELGPLEASHTYMLEKAGAASIDSVEGNSEAYLRCLVMKELLNLRTARFHLGNFVGYLKDTETIYDIGIASGVLYHMKNPVELIELLGQRVRSLFIWSHYYDKELIEGKEHVKAKFSESWLVEHNGYEHRLHGYGYGDALEWEGFCGGGAESCNWMETEEMLKAFNHFGFELVDQHLEPEHPNGPALWLALKNSNL